MKKLIITIGEKSYSLRFGYGCFRHLAETWKVKGLQDIMNRLGLIGEKITELGFDDLQMLIELVYSAIYANGNVEEIESFDSDECGDAILANPAILAQIITGLTDSLPKPPPEAQGKQKAVRPQTKKNLNS